MGGGVLGNGFFKEVIAVTSIAARGVAFLMIAHPTPKPRKFLATQLLRMQFWHAYDDCIYFAKLRVSALHKKITLM